MRALRLWTVAVTRFGSWPFTEAVSLTVPYAPLVPILAVQVWVTAADAVDIPAATNSTVPSSTAVSPTASFGSATIRDRCGRVFGPAISIAPRRDATFARPDAGCLHLILLERVLSSGGEPGYGVGAGTDHTTPDRSLTRVQAVRDRSRR